jgi:hypothetical protein
VSRPTSVEPSSRFPPYAGGKAEAVRAGVLLLLIGLAVAVIVYVATGGHVVFLPLVFLPFVFFWPGGRRRGRRS